MLDPIHPIREGDDMADHPNAEFVRHGYNAFIAGDMEWLNEHFDDTIVWHEAGNNQFSGDFRGRSRRSAMRMSPTTA